MLKYDVPFELNWDEYARPTINIHDIKMRKITMTSRLLDVQNVKLNVKTLI
jgi:hypothetical protein